MASDVPKYKISLPLLLTKLLFLSLRERVQRSATSSIKWRTQRLANLSGYKLQRIPASDESKGANDRLALSYCHYHHCQRKEGSFFFFLIIGSPPQPPTPYQQCLWRIWSLSLRLLNASKRFSNSGEPHHCVSFWLWSVDGTVGSCSRSGARAGKVKGGMKIHQLPKWEENSFILARVSLAKNNLVSLINSNC